MTGLAVDSAAAISDAELAVQGTILSIFCCVVLALTVISMIRLVHDPEQLHHLQRRLYLSRRISLVASAVVRLGTAAALIATGVIFLQTWPQLGWCFFPMAGVPLVTLGMRTYVQRLPFTYPEDL